MPIGEQLADLTRNDIVASAVKTAPPVSVAGATLLGYPIADWAIWATLIYTCLQIILLLRDNLFRRGKHPKKGWRMTPQDFIAAISPAAVSSMRSTKVPA